MPQRRRQDIELCGFNNEGGRIELLCIEIKINNEKWIIISIYKQPKVKTVNLNQCIDQLMNEFVNDVNVVIIGDTNENLLKPNSLKDCLDVNGLTNVIKDPTCFKCTPTLIDLCITNKPKRFHKSITVDTGLSDFHHMICTATKSHVPKQKAITINYRSYKHFDQAKFIQELSEAPYHVGDIFDDIDDSYSFFHKLTMDIVDKFAPMKTKQIKGKRIPYMNSELRKAINVKNMVKRKYYKCKNNENWLRYRSHRNTVTNLRKKSMRIYMQNKCNSAKTGGGFWEAVKPIISHKSVKKDDNIMLTNNGNLINNTSDICKMFNEYFINVTSDIGPDDRLLYDDDTESCVNAHENHISINCIEATKNNISSEFKFHTVDVPTTYAHLRNLNAKKATGHDMLPAKLINIACDVLCYPVCNLLNMCITQGKFPNMLKYADVSPIFKKGDRMDVNNYRPVSVLPSMSKVFEKELVNQLTPFFDKQFHPCVSGFRKGYSCETVLVNMVESVKQSLDNGKIVCAVLMDLSRAFDCVPHKLLIAKFRSYGISLAACDVMTHYLRDRKQRVKIGTQRSEWIHVHKGSAQGSLFGPFCYNVLANDMFEFLDDGIEIYNYADDNTVLCAGTCLDDIKHKLLTNVNKLMEWYRANHMKVNAGKFQCIVFGNVKDPGEFIIDNHSIVPKYHVELLGLLIDNKLNFNNHVSSICQKASRQVNVLGRLSKVIDESSKMLLYNSFVECYFNYCSTLWHFCSNNDTYKVEKIQKRALRYVTSDFNSSYESLLLISQKSPLYVVRLRKIVELVHKISQDKCPSYLKNLIESKTSNRLLRSVNNMYLPKFKTITFGKRSLKYTAPLLWNTLPEELNCSKLSVSAFKQQVKLWNGPICHCMYCVSCKVATV